ncbi:uncharacterized protein [Macrobrachium rosenbergii]|uniref:uncharacterized protein isoform X1 n=1 Tax=Macrobrachium rosenbergii TaxID=79674 RepID=UPI0034D450B0
MATITCEMSTRRLCPYLPEGLRKIDFSLVHNLSHPSGQSTAHTRAERYIWWGTRKDVKMWVRECIPCQMSKVMRHTDSGIEEFRMTNRQLAHIHVDTVGPLLPSEGYKHRFTIIDRNTRWPKAIPIQQQMAESCVKYLIDWSVGMEFPRSLPATGAPTLPPPYGTPWLTVWGRKSHKQCPTTLKQTDNQGVAQITESLSHHQMPRRKLEKRIAVGPAGIQNNTTQSTQCISSRSPVQPSIKVASPVQPTIKVASRRFSRKHKPNNI